MAPKIVIPKANQTGTPKGMEGVRPGSPKAIKAGHKPPKPLKGPGGPPMTVYFNADGTTTSKPPKAPAATTLTPPPPTPTPRAPFNYADAYYAYPGYGESMKGIEAQQGGIEAKYGFTIRRDTDTNSPTRGGAYYKPKGAAEGTGTILATISPVDGSYVYKDSAGKVYTAAELDIDVVTLKPGDPNYIQGALGATAATSDLNMRNLGDAAAQSGVGSSGIRGSMASQEGAARAAREFDLYGQGMADLGATTAKYAELYRTIFDAIKGQAADYNAVPPPVVETPAAVVAPVADTASSGSGFVQTVTPDAGGALSPGPGGEFMKLIGNATLERNTSDKAIREQLNNILTNPKYKLTAQQRNYIKSLLTGRYKGNKKY